MIQNNQKVQSRQSNISYKIVNGFQLLQVFQVLLKFLQRENELPLTEYSHF